ncbi:MAG: DUF2795 domain-containing protein [Desulfovibrionales bacterium]
MPRGKKTHSPADIAGSLKGIDFPAGKQDLIEQARHNHADQEVIDELERFPDQEYGNMADVMKGYGQEHEPA